MLEQDAKGIAGRVANATHYDFCRAGMQPFDQPAHLLNVNLILLHD